MLTEDMGFVQNAVISQDTFEGILVGQGNYTLSAFNPTSDWQVSRGSDCGIHHRLLYSLETIAQTYLRNAQHIYVEPKLLLPSVDPPISGTHSLPIRFREDASTLHGVHNLLDCIHGRSGIDRAIHYADKYYCRNLAAWRLLSESATFHLPWLYTRQIGQFSHSGVFIPNAGPRLHVSAGGRHPSYNRDPTIEDFPENQAALSRTRSRHVLPTRPSSSLPELSGPRSTIPRTLPLKQVPQGSLLKVVAVQEGNFLRQRYCYSPILPHNKGASSSFSFSSEFKSNICTCSRCFIETTADISGCPRCFRKIWIRTGKKPANVPVFEGETCWLSRYSYTGNQTCKSEQAEEMIPKDHIRDDGDDDDDEAVVRFGRKEGLRNWCKGNDGYIDAEDIISRLVKNDARMEVAELKQAMKSGWGNRSRPGSDAVGPDGEEKLRFWDDMIERDPTLRDDEALIKVKCCILGMFCSLSTCKILKQWDELTGSRFFLLS